MTDCQRQADIEITPEMIAAGEAVVFDALFGQPFSPDPALVAQAVYKAMRRLEPL